jgi:electron transport complex protein RnfC
MNIWKTFPKGGLYPREMKNRIKGKSLWNASLPALSIVPLLQHRGTAAECLVRPRETVREGMLIGRSRGPDSCHVHSPVPGTVQSVQEIILPGGEKSPAVFIELGGEFDRLGKAVQIYPWEDLRKDRLLSILSEKGVVGFESGIPVHSKLSIPEGKTVKFLIINGVESEPYLSAEYRVMIEKAVEFVEGVRIAAKITEAARCVIAVTREKREARNALKKQIDSIEAQIELMSLRPKYPLGDERQLIRAVTGEEISSGVSSLDAGIVVLNAGTVFAMYEAVVLQKPLIEKAITVAGRAIRTQGNLKVRLGTPLADLVEECGGFTQAPEKIIIGGPMRGWGISDLALPVTKTTAGVLFLSSREIRNSRKTNCLNCGRCIRSCPMGLNPSALYKWVEHSAYEEARSEGIMDCCECGCCAYACPARIPLIKEIRVGKIVLQEEGRSA